MASKNVEARVTDTGFNKGEVNVYVHDKLDYAALALKNGQTSVSLAISNALSKTLGYIMQRVKANGGSID